MSALNLLQAIGAGELLNLPLSLVNAGLLARGAEMGSVDFNAVNALITIGGFFLSIGLAVLAATHRSYAQVDVLRKEREAAAREIRLELEVIERDAQNRARDLHAKIDAIRAEYIRRDEFNSHMLRVETGMSNLGTLISNMNERLDRILVMLTKAPERSER